MIQASFSSALRRGRVLSALVALTLAAGCATTSADSRDPFESFNRAMWGFNQAVDTAVLKPVATAYKEGLPQIVQTGVRNFFSNLADVFISVNNLLQGKVIDAASDGMRFVVNTVFGGLGLLDWASEMGIEKHNEDFGQTFGRWGVGPGPYIVWPIAGSSTVRDSVGGLIDVHFDPVSNHDPIGVRNFMYLSRLVARRADLLDASRLLEEAALDKYVFERDAYLQRRRSLIYDGSPPRESERPVPGALGPPAEGGQGVSGFSVQDVPVGYEPRVPRNYEAVLSVAAQGDRQGDRQHAERN